MGFYNVVAPCVVGHLHHVRPTAQPIEVDDAEAEPLVDSGCLEPYRPGGITGKTGTLLEGFQRTVADLGGELAKAGKELAAEHSHQPGVDCPACVGDPSLVQTPIDDEPPTDPPPPRARGGRRKG